MKFRVIALCFVLSCFIAASKADNFDDGMYVPEEEPIHNFDCTLFMYPSRPDPNNLYDPTQSFVLPFDIYRGGSFADLPTYPYNPPQVYEGEINAIRYIVARGADCEKQCAILASPISRVLRENLFVTLTTGEIHALDKCYRHLELSCLPFV